MDALSILHKNRSAFWKLSSPRLQTLATSFLTRSLALAPLLLFPNDLGDSGLVLRKTPSTMKPLAIACRIPRLP
jgi:hypothetical protein